MHSFKQIKEISKVRRGASPRPINDPKYFGGSVGWIRISDVTKSKKFLRCTEQYLSPVGERYSVRVDKGELIMSICGTVGKPIIIDIPACIHDGFVLFENVENADKEYLYYALQHAERSFQNMGQPGTQVNLNTTLVSNHKIYWPDGNIKRKITKILSAIDAQIERTEAIIAKYQTIKQGMAHDLFTRGVEVVTGELRASYEEAPELYRETDYGMMPISWTIKSFEEVTLKIADRDHFTPTYVDQGVPIISPKDFDDNDEISFADCKFITQDAHLKNRNKTDLKVGDLVFTRIGALLGKACIVEKGMPEFSILHSAAMIRVGPMVIPEYLLYFIKSHFFQKQIASEIQSIGVPDLGLEKIKAFKLYLPKIEEQLRIVEKLTSVTNIIKAEKKNKLKLEKIKLGLMEDLLTGNVKVKVGETKLTLTT